VCGDVTEAAHNLLTIWWVFIGIAHAYRSSVTRCRRSGEDGSYARTRVSCALCVTTDIGVTRNFIFWKRYVCSLHIVKHVSIVVLINAHSCSKGISSSAIPYRRSVPTVSRCYCTSHFFKGFIALVAQDDF